MIGRSILLALFLFILMPLADGQQKQSMTFDIFIKPVSRVSEQMLPFDGEGEIRDGIPVYRFRAPLSKNNNLNTAGLSLDITNLSWKADSDPFIDSYPQSFEQPDYRLVHIRHETFVEVELIPYTTIDGRPHILESFTCTIHFTTNPQLQLKATALSDRYAANSVLASGKWIKIAVDQSGIHKIPYSTLTEWGFTNAANVSIFGHGGEMIPRANSEPRVDDLPQLAVWHHKNAVYFYAQGPAIWRWDESKNMFIHEIHGYTDKAFYFITDGAGTPRQVDIRETETTSATLTSAHFDDLRYHEQELNNLLRSGRRWYGEKLSPSEGLTKEFNFSFPSRDVSQPVKMMARVVCSDNVESPFEFRINQNAIPDLTLITPPISHSDYVGYYAHEKEGSTSVVNSESDLSVSVALKNQAPTVTGWLDYITLNARCHLAINNGQLLFRDKTSQGAGNITRFRLGNSTAETVVWDITNRTLPERLSTNLAGNDLVFIAATTDLKEFAAFNPSAQLPVPVKVEVVENQNLHATQPVDYIIVAAREFTEQARQLANLHTQHSGLSVLVVNAETIYNEFAWGHKDPTAIRSFVKMLYDRAEGDPSKTPKYLLLFGNGSFDNRSEDGKTKSHVITYQSENSIHRTNTYVTDDYFGFLDDPEGADDRYDRPDIGIGRFPVKTVEEAKTAVNKVKAYLENQAEGAWRKLITFVGDDEDSNIHMRDANLLAAKVENNYPWFDVRKIYLDNYEKVTSSTGKRFPEAEDMVNRTISEGTLIFNYVGHGSEHTLSAEQIINTRGIQKWNNIRNLPVFVTATCEFSRFDNPYLVSAGEETFLNPQGGAIALLSTTRVVYSSLNYQLNNAFFNYVFTHTVSGQKPALGDIIRQTKTASGSSVNKLNFTLLGDPALKLAYPNNRINLVKINENPVDAAPDTLKALSKIKLEAEVVSPEGERLNNFNGTADITVYDKPMKVKTLGNDGAAPFEFSQYSNILFKGKATVTEGKFTCDFMVPYDIRYNYAPGRISLYAWSEEAGEAFGANNEVIVGGFNLDAPDDFDGPEVELYLNDAAFKPGDQTGPAPMLYAKIRDFSGINTSGNGIGHDILLIIDGDKDNPVILNSYFQATPDTYQEGMVMFQLPQLPKGRHEITLKVWDSYNNSTIAGTWFEVGNSKELRVSNFMMVPNPVVPGGQNWFSFGVDEPNSTLSLMVDGITTAGTRTGTLRYEIVASGNYINPIPLSLSALGINRPGIYLIRFIISSNTGKESQITQKILVQP